MHDLNYSIVNVDILLIVYVELNELYAKKLAECEANLQNNFLRQTLKLSCKALNVLKLNFFETLLVDKKLKIQSNVDRARMFLPQIQKPDMQNALSSITLQSSSGPKLGKKT